MDKQARVDTWEECEQRLLQIENDNGKSLTGVWFRGQSDASWCLKTTLERRSRRLFFIREYWELSLRIKPIIETITGKTWKTTDWSEPSWPIESYFRDVMDYDYIAHLRHHSFPSPLLDWSRSPYIAAYFAFASPTAAHDVVIYAFSETPHNIKSSANRGPKIISHGGYNLKTHERHFRQKSSYTVCVEQDEATRGWRFVPHERSFDHKDTEMEQDVLYRTIIPSSERTKVLKILDRFNSNGFSLFGSEESIMDTLAFREIDLKLA
jgi:FRG domain